MPHRRPLPAAPDSRGRAGAQAAPEGRPRPCLVGALDTRHGGRRALVLWTDGRRPGYPAWVSDGVRAGMTAARRRTGGRDPNRALAVYRRKVWKTGPGVGVPTLGRAARFIGEVGLCLLFGCEEIPLPKLELCGPPDFEWWEWKDHLQERRQAYLGRVVRRKATLIAMPLLPAFLGLYYADGGVEVYDEEHHHGRLSDDAWRIGEHLSRHGPAPVDQLRRTLTPPGPAGTRRFHRALDEMQEKFKTVTVGRVRKHWSVRIIGLVSDWAPAEILRQAHVFTRRPDAARERILERAVLTAGALGVREAAAMFGWPRAETERAAAALVARGAVREARPAGPGTRLVAPRVW